MEMEDRRMATGLKANIAAEIFSSRLAGETPSRVAEIFKALGDETRLAIVQILVGRELCVCDILDAFDMSQPAISHHLKILRQAGVVQDTREGKWIYYRLNPSALKLISTLLAVIQKDIDLKERTGPSSPNRL